MPYRPDGPAERPSDDHPAENGRTSCNYMAQGYFPQPATPAAKPPKKTKSRIWLYRATLVLLLAVFIFAAYQVAAYVVHSQKAKQEEAMIRTLIAEADDGATVANNDAAVFEGSAAAAENAASPLATAPQAASPRATPAEPTPPPALTEFSRALAINPDTVGKLKLGESIDTYVVQRDNSYYLRRSFTQEYSYSGAIFIDVTCSIYPQSRMLIIHGHNMKDGTAFGKLSRYKNVDYLNQYPIIYFSTLYEAAQYQPFAVVYYSIDHKAGDYLDLYQCNGLSDDEFIAFVQKVQSMSAYRLPVLVRKTDQIIVLTTCTTDDPDMRFAIFAVKRSLL